MRNLRYALLCAALAAGPAWAQSETVSDGVIRVGVLNDQSGPYADLSGQGSVLAAQMASEQFGGNINGVPIEILSADHQNKPDIGVSIARKWFDVDKVDVIVDIGNSAVSLAINELMRDNHKLVLHNSASAALTGPNCAPRSIQWQYNVYAASSTVVTPEMIKDGMDTFYVIAVDYALGESITDVFVKSIESMGGKVLGVVRHPLNTSDMSSYLLQAQASGAKAIMLANAGADLGTAVRQAQEYGITPDVKLLAAALTTDVIDANGLDVMAGVQMTSQYDMYRRDEAKAWLEKFTERKGTPPTSLHAATYSEVLNYLDAIESTASDDPDTVLDWLREQTINDVFASNGHIRSDGVMAHDMYLSRIKSSDESSGPGDYFNVLSVIPGDEAFIPLAESQCPLVKK